MYSPPPYRYASNSDASQIESLVLIAVIIITFPCVCCLTSLRLYRWYERRHQLDGQAAVDDTTDTRRRKGGAGDQPEKARFSIPEVSALIQYDQAR